MRVTLLRDAGARRVVPEGRDLRTPAFAECSREGAASVLSDQQES
jgi:hypothetical protein